MYHFWSDYFSRFAAPSFQSEAFNIQAGWSDWPVLIIGKHTKCLYYSGGNYMRFRMHFLGHYILDIPKSEYLNDIKFTYSSCNLNNNLIHLL